MSHKMEPYNNFNGINNVFLTYCDITLSYSRLRKMTAMCHEADPSKLYQGRNFHPYHISTHQYGYLL